MEEQQLVVFALDDEKYAVPISQVREIIMYQGVTKIPASVPCLEGIINLRGKVIPVITLAKKLNKSMQIAADYKVVIIENKVQDFGIIVTEITQVLTINESQIEFPPSLVGNNKCIKGIGKTDTQLLILLDLQNLLDEQELDDVIKLC